MFTARNLTVTFFLFYHFFKANRVRYTSNVSLSVSRAILASFCHLVTFLHACHKFDNFVLIKNNVPISPWKFYVLLKKALWRLSLSIRDSFKFAVCAFTDLYIGLCRHLFNAYLKVNFLYMRCKPLHATFWALVNFLSFAKALMFEKPF